jgi:hypothetical protein
MIKLGKFTFPILIGILLLIMAACGGDDDSVTTNQDSGGSSDRSLKVSVSSSSMLVSIEPLTRASC